MSKCQSIKRFLRLLRDCDEYRFKLVPTSRLIRNTDGRGGVHSHSLYWQSHQCSYWSPLSVVQYAYFRSSENLWLPATMAADAMGLPKDKADEIIDACHERRRHNERLRERLLAACRVAEVPHSERQAFRRTKKNGNQDTRKAKAKGRKK